MTGKAKRKGDKAEREAAELICELTGYEVRRKLGAGRTDDEGDLEGLPDWLRDAAAQAATEREHAGKWAILNTRSSMDPFLTYSARRDLREKVWRTYYDRGDHGDARDNNPVITEILALRAEPTRRPRDRLLLTCVRMYVLEKS